MKTAIFLTDWEIRIINKALIDYEENHYESESQGWQKKINSLMDTIKAKGVEHRGVE